MTLVPLIGELLVGPVWLPLYPVWPWGLGREWGLLLSLTKLCLSCQLDPKHHAQTAS